jgi:hypothetical protein
LGRRTLLVLFEPRSTIQDDAGAPALARFPIERNRSIDEKSRQIKKLERILVEQVYQLVQNRLYNRYIKGAWEVKEFFSRLSCLFVPERL